MRCKLIFLIAIILFLTVSVFSLNITTTSIDNSRQERIDFGYVLNIDSVNTTPENLIPGEAGVINLNIKNTANLPLYDIRIDINLPSKISFLNDVSKKKLYKMEANQEKIISYNIIPAPDISEGVYSINYTITYLNNVATERQESYDSGIIVRSNPKIFTTISSTDIYQGKLNGKVTINFINNNLANIKFLTVELKDSPDYDILSDNKQYIGDLNSDDFDSTEFNLKVIEGKSDIPILLKIEYRDSLNRLYSQDIELNLNIKDPKELGIKQTISTTTWIIILAVILVFYVIFRAWKNKKNKK
jgi:hypothetical protein